MGGAARADCLCLLGGWGWRPQESTATGMPGKGSSQGCPQTCILRRCVPRVFSLPQVCVPAGRALRGYTCFPPPRTQSSLCPLGLKVKVNVAPGAGGEALEPEGLPLTGSQLSTRSLFPRLVGQAGRRMGANHPWRHGSWSKSRQGPQSLGRHRTGHRGRGQPWSPDWRAAAGRPGGLRLVPRGGGHPRPPALPLLLGLWP